jgi:hypothetical protein
VWIGVVFSNDVQETTPSGTKGEIHDLHRLGRHLRGVARRAPDDARPALRLSAVTVEPEI